MSLFPTYTPPPDIGWVSALWADDVKNHSHPNNPNASIDKIQATHGGNVLGLTLGSSRPHFVTQSQYLGNRGAWVADAAADGIWGSMVDHGQQMTLVAVAAYTAIPGAGVPHMAYTGNIGLSNSGGGVRVVGSNNDSIPYVRLSINTPILYTAYTNRPTTANVRSSLNGNQFTRGALNNPLTSSTMGLGTTASGGNSGFWHMGFYGIYQGDATTSPYWSDFLDWVQSHYGFDPRSTYDTSLPPPIDWKAEYLADDFDTTTGTWPDRTDRGYTLSGGLGIRSAGLQTGNGGFSTVDSSSPYGRILGSYTGFVDVKWKWAPSAGIVNGGALMGDQVYGDNTNIVWLIDMSSTQVRFVFYDSAGVSYNSSILPPASLSSGSEQWWRVKFDWVAKTVTWWTGSDGSDWVQFQQSTNVGIGNPIRTSGTSAFAVGGSTGAGGNPAVYSSYSALYKRVIVSDATGDRLDVDFEAATDWSDTVADSVTGKLLRGTTQAGNTILSTPTKVDNVVNGQPVVRFDGVDDYLKTTGLSLAAPFTTVAVVKATPTIAPILGAGNNTFLPGMNGAWEARNGVNNSIAYGATSPSNWNLLRMYDNGSTGGVFAVNETVLASGLTIGGSTLTDLYLTTNAGAGLWCAADFAYVGVFYGDVTTSALWPAFKTWVTNKYGITVA